MYAGPASSNPLLARVSSFLPTIRAANEALVAAADGAGGAEGTAVIVLDTDLQAVHEGGNTTSDDEGDADASSSSTRSSSDVNHGSESDVINGAVAVDNSDDEESASSAASGEKKQARKKRKKNSSTPPRPPTIVMDFQLGSFQDNATMALIAHHDRSDADDDGKDESEDDRTPRTDAEALVRNLLASKGTQPSKQRNGPLISEIAP